MPQFHYQATTPQGKVIEGIMEAGEERVVVSRLHEQGYLPLRVVLPGQEKSKATFSWDFLPTLPGSGIVRQRDLLILTQELETLIAAGLPLDRALSVLTGPCAAAGPSEPLTIVSQSGRHAFQVEIADEPGERATGLMNRYALAPDAGMLFDFGEARPIDMWMKNTYIPLDMVFIRADGTIHRVAANTVPHSLATVSSGAPVRFVLEVGGGTAARLGIRRGDRVEHRLIGAESGPGRGRVCLNLSMRSATYPVSARSRSKLARFIGA